MGKSDQYIFPEYLKMLDGLRNPVSVAFLGSSKHDNFTNSITAKEKHFFDLSLKNWEINSDWILPQKYDLIISTRCPYFSKNPDLFINKCKNSLKNGGHALIDWGLGDHWRFDKYKVGWIRDEEHEFAYSKDNFLYSCFWNEDLENHSEVLKFWNAIKLNPEFGYYKENALVDIIKKEVTTLISYKTKNIEVKFLWPDRPQLYIITLIKNE